MIISKTTAILGLIIGVGAGIGAGLGIGKLTQQPKIVNQFAPDTTRSGELPFKRALFIKGKYKEERLSQSPGEPERPNTECIVHNFDEFFAYANKLNTFFSTVDDSEFPGFKAGVALYLGKSYAYNYMQIHGMDTSYLLQNKYTIFISPVLYRDTTRREFPFREIEGPGSPRQNQRLFVNVLDSLVSPFNDKEALIESKFHKRVKLFFDTDPDAFDLGHTNP